MDCGSVNIRASLGYLVILFQKRKKKSPEKLNPQTNKKPKSVSSHGEIHLPGAWEGRHQ